MENLILEPLKYYKNVAKSQHEKNINEFFNQLVDKSKIDVQENRKTAESFRKYDKMANKTKSKVFRLKGWRIFLIILGILSVVALFVGIFALQDTAQVLVIIASVILMIFSFAFVFLKLNVRIKKTQELYEKQRKNADQIYQTALSQMQALNDLFTEYDTFNLIEKVIPGLKFNREYTVEMDEDFRTNFAFESDTNDNNRSVVNTVSGRYNENPFLFYRHLNHYMSTKTYQGTKVITWTERVRDSDGRTRVVTRTQTLVATVTKPYPEYAYATALNYGHQIAPDLNFSRKYKHIEDWSEQKVDKKVKKGEKKLKKKAEKALMKGEKFTEMANSEFDVLFDAIDRDNEVQFRLMFSPSAQLNMVRLMRSEDGYGDDFSFVKHGKHNYIVSEHAQKWNMDTSPKNYYSYDVDIALNNFKNFNNEYFKSVYFDLAPLLAIPTYHEKPSLTFEKYPNIKQNYSEYEYEVLANVIGTQNFAHSQSRTESILKAQFIYSENNTDYVKITAHSYSTIPRVDFVPVLGGDGRMHAVPVPWDEYIPVQNERDIVVKRLGVTDNQFNSKKQDLDGSLFGMPYGFYHGLFAKIVQKNEADYIDSALNKI